MRLCWICLLIPLALHGCFPIKRTTTADSFGKVEGNYKSKDGQKDQAFIFKDYQLPDKFDTFLREKYQLQKHQTRGYIPIEIKGTPFFLIYDRFQDEDVYLNLWPILLQNDEEDTQSLTKVVNDKENDLSSDLTLTNTFEFIAIRIYDGDFNNALMPKSLFVNIAKDYTQQLKEEYKQYVLKSKSY
ncbi:MAG: hypothetical protein KKC03_10900 [Bacteroidetes bacterium]|nr:hypothetical protein [Bacteroidota bacterium]